MDDGPEIRAAAGAKAGSELLFDAVLQPHRSLPPLGFLVLMVAIAGISFSAGIAFLMQGAWPVFGFFGLDVTLIYLAFKFNYRSGRMIETLQLSSDELRVSRILPSGRVRCWTFEPNWMRVLMDSPPQHHSQLVLTTHGRRLTVGAFLTPGERLEVADALREALADWRRSDAEA